MVCGGDEFCDGIGGGCSCGGGGNISDQFGTKRWLFWLLPPLLPVVPVPFPGVFCVIGTPDIILRSTSEVEVRFKKSCGSPWGIDMNVFPFWKKSSCCHFMSCYLLLAHPNPKYFLSYWMCHKVQRRRKVKKFKGDTINRLSILAFVLFSILSNGEGLINIITPICK